MKIVCLPPDETDQITSDEVVDESVQCQTDDIIAATDPSSSLPTPRGREKVIGVIWISRKRNSFVRLRGNRSAGRGLTSSSNLVKNNREEAHGGYTQLPQDIKRAIFNKVSYEELCRLKLVSKESMECIESRAYQSFRGKVVNEEGTITALNFFTNDGGSVQWSGFDVFLKKWRPLPTLSYLPSPCRELFKDYLISASGGLFCAHSSRSSGCKRVVVCNPLTQTSRVLPPLNLPRNPVLLRILGNEEDNSYIVIVAGSSGMTAEHALSRKTEVFDSRTSTWEVKGDLPTLEYGLNEYQTGVYINKLLYCIAFLEDGFEKGVLAYNVEEGKWLGRWSCPLPLQQHANFCTIAQLVKCDEDLYLFLESELPGQPVEHRIYKLETDLVAADQPAIPTSRWIEVVKEEQVSSRGLCVYPEYTCVSFGEGKLCIFNTNECESRVYDVRNGHRLREPLPSLGKETKVIHALNPLSDTFEPMFKSKPCYTCYSRCYCEGYTSSDSDFDAMLLERWHFDPQLPANAEATELSIESDHLQLFPPII